MKSELGRRTIMVRLMQGMGALSVGAFGSAEEHIHPSFLTASQEAPSANWTARFFNTSQNETMVALSEQLIPGSKEALCNRLIDLVLLIESEKNRTELIQALSAFDAEAKRLHGKAFHESTPEQQNEILSMAAGPGGKLHAEFVLAKEWTADAYWSSLKGLRELGWTGRVAWDSFPDCQDFHSRV